MLHVHVVYVKDSSLVPAELLFVSLIYAVNERVIVSFPDMKCLATHTTSTIPDYWGLETRLVQLVGPGIVFCWAADQVITGATLAPAVKLSMG